MPGNEHFSVERQAHPRAAAVYDALGSSIDALQDDPAFQAAWKELDVDDLTKAFRTFSSDIGQYNKFHLRERRMWALKLGAPGRPAITHDTDTWRELEQDYIARIPAGRAQYVAAFESVGVMHALLDRAGFGPVVERHLGMFTTGLFEAGHPFGTVVRDYFRSVGCAPAMIEEFQTVFRSVAGNLTSVSREGFSGLREVTDRAVEAQLSIIDETAEHGFSYLRGRCGPPAWAVTAAKILAAAGISVSAWVLVVIIVALLALLVIICAAAPRGSWLGQQCSKLNVLLPIFRF